MVSGVQPSADGMGSSSFMPPSLGALCSLGRRRGCSCWKVLYALSILHGPGIVRPAFMAHVRRYAWKMRHTGHWGSER